MEGTRAASGQFPFYMFRGFVAIISYPTIMTRRVVYNNNKNEIETEKCQKIGFCVVMVVGFSFWAGIVV